MSNRPSHKSEHQPCYDVHISPPLFIKTFDLKRDSFCLRTFEIFAANTVIRNIPSNPMSEKNAFLSLKNTMFEPKMNFPSVAPANAPLVPITAPSKNSCEDKDGFLACKTLYAIYPKIKKSKSVICYVS